MNIEKLLSITIKAVELTTKVIILLDWFEKLQISTLLPS